MGKFTDNIRRILNPEKQKQIELNRLLGLKDNAKLKNIKEMRDPHNAYFIRLASDHRLYLKFFNGEYFIQEGPEMACIFTYQNALGFIKDAAYADLEMIRVDEALKK